MEKRVRHPERASRKGILGKEVRVDEGWIRSAASGIISKGRRDTTVGKGPAEDCGRRETGKQTRREGFWVVRGRKCQRGGRGVSNK